MHFMSPNCSVFLLLCHGTKIINNTSASLSLSLSWSTEHTTPPPSGIYPLPFPFSSGRPLPKSPLHHRVFSSWCCFLSSHTTALSAPAPPCKKKPLQASSLSLVLLLLFIPMFYLYISSETLLFPLLCTCLVYSSSSAVHNELVAY